MIVLAIPALLLLIPIYRYWHYRRYGATIYTVRKDGKKVYYNRPFGKSVDWDDFIDAVRNR